MLSTQIHIGGHLSFGLCSLYNIDDRLYVFVADHWSRFYNCIMCILVAYCMFDIAGIFYSFPLFQFGLHILLTVCIVH